MEFSRVCDTRTRHDQMRTCGECYAHFGTQEEPDDELVVFLTRQMLSLCRSLPAGEVWLLKHSWYHHLYFRDEVTMILTFPSTHAAPQPSYRSQLSRSAYSFGQGPARTGFVLTEFAFQT